MDRTISWGKTAQNLAFREDPQLFGKLSSPNKILKIRIITPMSHTHYYCSTRMK